MDFFREKQIMVWLCLTAFFWIDHFAFLEVEQLSIIAIE